MPARRPSEQHRDRERDEHHARAANARSAHAWLSAELSIESPIDWPNASSAKAPIARVPALIVSTSASPYFCRVGPVLLDAVDAIQAAFDLPHEACCP